MAEIVNLRIARKRAARGKAESLAAEQRHVHGVSKAERSQSEGESDRQRKLLDQHRIETGDHR